MCILARNVSKSRLISDAVMSATADSSCGELSETKHLWFNSVWEHRGKIDARFFSRECGIGMDTVRERVTQQARSRLRCNQLSISKMT